MVSPRTDVPDVFEIDPVRTHARELRGGRAVVLLPRQLIDEIESHAGHRHLELLPVRRGVDATLRQLGDEIGIRLIGEMPGALAVVEPAVTVERAGGPYDLEMHRDPGSPHVRRGQTHELTHGHVVLAVPAVVVAALAVTDGEPDKARTLTRLDQPLAVGRDGALLGRERRSGQEADQEKDGEPHRDSGSGFTE